VTKRRRVAWQAGQVRELRGRLGLSQQALADELGIRQATVSDWERGLYAPRGGSARLLLFLAERAGLAYGEQDDPLHE
jgi:DNA-binding transcriptional regulator YiaG